MGAWVPLFQTLAWVLLLVGVLWRFNSEVRALVRSILMRIETGSSVEAGPLKLGPSAPAQAIEQQRSKLQNEVEEISAAAKDTPRSSSLRQQIGGATLRMTAMLAEDLAIRQIQAEFGVSVSRQVSLKGLSLDGLFTVQDQTTYAIEVKYVFRALEVRIVRDRLAGMLSQAAAIVHQRFVVILALVYAEKERLTDAERGRIHSALTSFGENVVVRFYLYDDLAHQVGAIDGP